MHGRIDIKGFKFVSWGKITFLGGMLLRGMLLSLTNVFGEYLAGMFLKFI